MIVNQNWFTNFASLHFAKVDYSENQLLLEYVTWKNYTSKRP